MAGVKNGSSLVRATLSIHHPPSTLTGGLGGQLGQVRFQFNPNQLQLSRSAAWNSQPSIGFTRGASPEFTGTNPASLQVEVFLDGSAKPSASKVREDVEQLLACCEVDPQSLPTKRPSPPWVRFAWGSFSTVQFVAYVESVSATYTLFTATGDPLRANCQLSLTEVPMPTKGQNPTSGTWPRNACTGWSRATRWSRWPGRSTATPPAGGRSPKPMRSTTRCDWKPAGNCCSRPPRR